MSAEVAVVVVSWNTRDLLRECLRSIEADRASGLAEVWVVDNCSTDGSPEMVEREFPAVRLKRPAENLGFGPAVNLGAEASRSRWLVAANADIALEPGALGRLVEAAREDERLGAVAPRLIGPDGGTQHSLHRFPGLGLSLSLYSGAGELIAPLADRLLFEGRTDMARPRRVDWAHGAMLLFSRQAFDAAGGFDPGQWMYAEDLDIAWRLRGAGYAVGYEPSARVRHAGAAATAQAFGDARRERYMAATYAWMVRRRGLARTWAFALLNVAGSAVRYALAAPAARFGGGASHRDMWRSYLRLHLRGLRSRRRLLSDSA